MTYDKQRIITVTPRALAATLLSAAAIVGTYLYMHRAENPTSPPPVHRKLTPEQQKDTLYTLLNEKSPQELLHAIPDEKRKALLEQAIAELPSAQKIELIGRGAKESLNDLLSAAESYSTRIMGGPVHYGHFSPRISAEQAATEIVTTLGGK